MPGGPMVMGGKRTGLGFMTSVTLTAGSPVRGFAPNPDPGAVNPERKAPGFMFLPATYVTTAAAGNKVFKQVT